MRDTNLAQKKMATINEFKRYFETAADKRLKLEVEDGEVYSNIDNDFAEDAFCDWCCENNISEGDEGYPELEAAFYAANFAEIYNAERFAEAADYEPDDPNWQY